MAEAFGFYADNILTRDHFEAVLDAKLDARFAQQDTKLDQRFADIDRRFTEQGAKVFGYFSDQNARFGGRFGKLEISQRVHTWMLGFLVLTLGVPQVQTWLASAGVF